MSDDQKRKGRGCLRTLIILAIIGFGFVVAISVVISFVPKKATAGPGTILEMTLTGSIAEGPKTSFLGELTGSYSLSTWNIRRALRAAAADPNIVGLRVLIQTPTIGWGASEEILREMDKFRESKKPIYILFQSDMITDIDIFLQRAGTRYGYRPRPGC